MAAESTPTSESSATPLVSVLMPSYNTAPYIEACLRSVTEQSYQALEIVICDDRSTDGTYELLEELVRDDQRITLMRNETNLGSHANFKKLLGLANGKYLNFVCCDDVLLGDSLERKVALLEDHPDVGLAAVQRIIIDTEGRPIPDRNDYIWTHTPFGYEQGTYLVDGFSAGDSMLIDLNNWIGEPTAAMFRVGALSPEDPYVIGTARPYRNVDLMWWLNLLAGKKLGYVNEALTCFRHHPGQKSRQAALVPDLTLAWYDLIVGAREVGYLKAPELEMRTLVRLAEHITSRAPALFPDHAERTTTVMNSIYARLQELQAQ